MENLVHHRVSAVGITLRCSKESKGCCQYTCICKYIFIYIYTFFKPPSCCRRIKDVLMGFAKFHVYFKKFFEWFRKKFLCVKISKNTTAGHFPVLRTLHHPMVIHISTFQNKVLYERKWCDSNHFQWRSSLC